MTMESRGGPLPPRHAAGAAVLEQPLAAIGERGVALLIAVLMALVLASTLGHTINNDVAWYIHSAGAFLDGGHLYDDVFFDVNPPLMLYLTVPGVAFGRLTGLFPVHAYLLTVFAVAAFSLWLGTRLLAGAPARLRHTFLSFGFLALVALPAGDFGQRSHLMVCLALPYLLLAAVRLARFSISRDQPAPPPGHPARWYPVGDREGEWAGAGSTQVEHALENANPRCGRGLAAVVGIAAGLGFAIKPHYLLVPAALEIMLLWRTRRVRAALRPETLALGTVVACYAAAIAIFTPLYLTRVVPYALEVYNAAYRNGLGFVLARPETILLPLALLAHRRARPALEPRSRALADVLGLAALVLFGVYLVQMKGWNYHVYPTTALLVMLAGVLVSAPRALGGPVRALAMIAIFGLVTKAALVSDNRYPLMDRMMPFARAPGVDAIYVFASNTWTGFPLAVYAGVEWASRFPALWLLPGIEQRRHAAGYDGDTALLAEMDRFTTEAVIADLSAYRPEVVFVDARAHKPWYRGIDFDFIAHFSADPRFAALWAGYEKIGEDGGFEIYRRRPSLLS